MPEQKTGPLKFEIQDGVLRILHQAAIVSPSNLAGANSARTGLIASSAKLLAELSLMNYDRRIVGAISDIHDTLSQQIDVIQLGLNAISFQMVCDAASAELPDVLSAQLRALALQIGMYVGQFQEWIKFADNAAAADYSAADVEALTRSGKRLVEQLRAAAEAVDPEVPRSISFLLEAINNPKRAGKRMVFATIRSIENLVSVIIKSCGTALGGAVEGMRKGAKTSAYILTASILLPIAADTASAVSPAANRILHTSWIGKAGELISKTIAPN